jgi:hypothetical protein
MYHHYTRLAKSKTRNKIIARESHKNLVKIWIPKASLAFREKCQKGIFVSVIDNGSREQPACIEEWKMCKEDI